MYDYENAMTQCQSEIRRLRSVIRQEEEEIIRLKTLLHNAVEYIAESNGSLGRIDADEEKEWFENTLGITDCELESIGFAPGLQ